MLRFFRHLFSGGRGLRTPSQPSSSGGHLFLDLECERCGEQFHLHISRSTDCLQIFDEPGVAWRLQREVVGARCRTTIHVRIDFSPGGQTVHREITHGRFLTSDEASRKV